MRLFTMQKKNVIKDTYRFYPNNEISIWDDAFIHAYEWIIDKMKNYDVLGYDKSCYPVWFWDVKDCKFAIDRYALKFAIENDQEYIEIEVPDDEFNKYFLRTDFDSWHSVLNNGPIVIPNGFEYSPIDGSVQFKNKEDEEAFNKAFDEKYDRICSLGEDAIRDSWDKCIVDNRHIRNGVIYQYTSFIVKPEWIKNKYDVNEDIVRKVEEYFKESEDYNDEESRQEAEEMFKWIRDNIRREK